MKRFAKFIWNLCGWTFIGDLDRSIKKFVMIMAPHTSNWDFVWGRLGLWMMGIKVQFLIKKEFFVFPVKGILKSMGGVPVDRGNKKNDMVKQVCRMFKENDEFGIMITPEGTRSYNKVWKKGFYKIAMEANVPVAITFLDYKKKQGGILEAFYMTGDYEKDMAKIESFYLDKTAKYPEKFNLSPMHREQNKSNR
ncbi:1-acyl-sn-glycerol-3-phosphate acyltransferase [Bacteroidales bacterium OttesenSCG-928-C19]|nr:1-acyl-sn-glycerol-3-phosphate acyltransferase [Bacteroidales bacterium OttesenSCG-928-C19]